MSFSPIDVLNEARRAVPVVDYALGVAGVAAAAVLVTDFIGNGRASIVIFGAVLVGMLLLILLGRLLKSESPAVMGAAIAMTWAGALFFIIFLGFTTTAAAFYWPAPWADFLGMSKRNAPLYHEGQPSFSCILDRNEDEQAICHDATLSAKDVTLDDRYQKLKRDLPAEKFKAIHDAQIAWLAKRRNCGASVNCIGNLYDERLAALDSVHVQ